MYVDAVQTNWIGLSQAAPRRPQLSNPLTKAKAVSAVSGTWHFPVRVSSGKMKMIHSNSRILGALMRVYSFRTFFPAWMFDLDVGDRDDRRPSLYAQHVALGKSRHVRARLPPRLLRTRYLLPSNAYRIRDARGPVNGPSRDAYDRDMCAIKRPGLRFVPTHPPPLSSAQNTTLLPW